MAPGRMLAAMARKSVEVTITLTEESYWTLVRLIHSATMLYEDDSPESKVVRDIRDSLDGQVGKGGKVFRRKR